MKDETTVKSMELELLTGKPTVIIRVRVSPQMKDKLIEECKARNSDESKLIRIALAKELALK